MTLGGLRQGPQAYRWQPCSATLYSGTGPTCYEYGITITPDYQAVISCPSFFSYTFQSGRFIDGAAGQTSNPCTGWQRLYDLTSDPGATNNIASQSVGVSQQDQVFVNSSSDGTCPADDKCGEQIMATSVMTLPESNAIRTIVSQTGHSGYAASAKSVAGAPAVFIMTQQHTIYPPGIVWRRNDTSNVGRCTSVSDCTIAGNIGSVNITHYAQFQGWFGGKVESNGTNTTGARWGQWSSGFDSNAVYTSPSPFTPVYSSPTNKWIAIVGSPPVGTGKTNVYHPVCTSPGVPTGCCPVTTPQTACGTEVTGQVATYLLMGRLDAVNTSWGLAKDPAAPGSYYPGGVRAWWAPQSRTLALNASDTYYSLMLIGGWVGTTAAEFDEWYNYYQNVTPPTMSVGTLTTGESGNTNGLDYNRGAFMMSAGITGVSFTTAITAKYPAYQVSGWSWSVPPTITMGGNSTTDFSAIKLDSTTLLIQLHSARIPAGTAITIPGA